MILSNGMHVQLWICFTNLYTMLWWIEQWTKHRWSLRNQFKTYFCFKSKHQRLYFVISMWSWLEMDCLFSSCYILSNSGLVVVQQMNCLMLHASNFIPMLKIELELLFQLSNRLRKCTIFKSSANLWPYIQLLINTSNSCVSFVIKLLVCFLFRKALSHLEMLFCTCLIQSL